MLVKGRKCISYSRDSVGMMLSMVRTTTVPVVRYSLNETYVLFRKATAISRCQYRRVSTNCWRSFCDEYNYLESTLAPSKHTHPLPKPIRFFVSIVAAHPLHEPVQAALRGVLLGSGILRTLRGGLLRGKQRRRHVRAPNRNSNHNYSRDKYCYYYHYSHRSYGSVRKYASIEHRKLLCY